MTPKNKVGDFLTVLTVQIAKSLLKDACKAGTVPAELASHEAYQDGFVVGATLVMEDMNQFSPEDLMQMTRSSCEQGMSLDELLNRITQDHWAQLQASPGIGGKNRPEPLFREAFLLGAKTAFYTAKPTKKAIKKLLGLKWWESVPPMSGAASVADR